MIRNGASWVGFSLFAGESEYVGFSIDGGGTVQYYCNASYYTPQNTFVAANGQAIELQIEFDGNQTHVMKARNYDPTDTASWTTIGTKTFLPKIDLTLQINQVGASGTALFGRIDVTGSEVWQVSDVPDWEWWLPVHSTNYCLEWGIEFELANAADRGVQHFLTHAGGLTIQAVTDRYGNGGHATWDQTNLSTAYATGTYSYQSTTINPAEGYKYGAMQLIGGLRSGGAGSSLSVSLRKSDGSLVPSSDLKGASNPVVFTSSLAEVKTLDMSDIGYTGLYFEINGESPNSTTHISPTTTTDEGMTGPPVLKQASVTFIESTGSTSATVTLAGTTIALSTGSTSVSVNGAVVLAFATANTSAGTMAIGSSAGTRLTDINGGTVIINDMQGRAVAITGI
jgi:hypothetical protein